MKKKPQQRRHWYRIHMDACVLCGRGDTVRERVYGPKPKDPTKRYIYTDYACGDHFL